MTDYTQYPLRMTAETFAQVKKAAAEADLTVAQWLRAAAREKLERDAQQA